MKSHKIGQLLIRTSIAILLLASSRAWGETCVKTQTEIDRNPSFKSALNGKSLFGLWRGPMGSSIDVRTDGKTILHHPVRGKINLAVSLCLERSEVYLRMNGNKFAFADSKLDSIRISDPQDPRKNKHLFRHVR